MDNKNLRGLILLTYKGKILLMYKSSGPMDKEKHPWCFIGGNKSKRESFETAMGRLVKEEMGVEIGNIELMLEPYCHAKLTDDNVNRIKRAENQLLDFFSPKEVKKLFLSSPTQEFMSKCGFKEMEALSSDA